LENRFRANESLLRRHNAHQIRLATLETALETELVMPVYQRNVPFPDVTSRTKREVLFEELIYVPDCLSYAH
jgi:hypothetical protein